MSDNDLTLTLAAKVDQALSGLDKVSSKIDTLVKKQDKLKESSTSFGVAAGVAFGAVTAGATAALAVAEKIAGVIRDIDRNLADLSKRGGASNLSLSQSLTGLGVQDVGRTQRQLRETRGTLNQGEIDSFVGSLTQANESLSGKRVAGLTRVAAGGAPVIGNLEALSELQDIFGESLSAQDLGDLAVKYRQSVGGGFVGENAKGVRELQGAGVDPYQALALSSAFNDVGQKKGVSGLATYLQGGGSIDKAFAGDTGDKGLDRAIAAVLASGRSLSTIARDEAGFRSVTSEDTIGNALAALPPETQRELRKRKDSRDFEINRNVEADSGAGLQARQDSEEVADAIAAAEAEGGAGAAAKAFLYKTTSGVLGDRVTAGALRTDATIRPSLNPLMPIKVEIQNANPASGY